MVVPYRYRCGLDPVVEFLYTTLNDLKKSIDFIWKDLTCKGKDAEGQSMVGF